MLTGKFLCLYELQVAFTSSSLFHHTNCQLKVELILTFISIASLCVSDVTLDCDPKIPLVAHELMKKMIHKFAEEYASKCLLRTTTNGVTRPSSPVPETSDAPLDLTVNRTGVKSCWRLKYFESK